MSCNKVLSLLLLPCTAHKLCNTLSSVLLNISFATCSPLHFLRHTNERRPDSNSFYSSGQYNENRVNEFQMRTLNYFRNCKKENSGRKYIIKIYIYIYIERE